MRTVYRQRGFECRSLGALQGLSDFRQGSNVVYPIADLKAGKFPPIKFKIETVDCVSKINTDPLFVIGSVEFLEKYIGKRTPDYYPVWASNFLRRKVIQSPRVSDYGLKHKWFVKPKSEYKKFEGMVLENDKIFTCRNRDVVWKKLHGDGVLHGEEVLDDPVKFSEFEMNHFEPVTKEPCIYSEVVNFVDEWRYYVANGKVLCSWWYKGSDETCEKNPHGPSIAHMRIPSSFCGAIDMGILDTGELALVEVQHPYAIGWYGDNDTIADYFDFLKLGFEDSKYN